MDVEFAFLADAAEASSDGKMYVLGAGIDRLFAPNFPAMHPSMALVVKIRVHPTECDRDHRLEIQLWEPDGRPVGMQLTGGFRAGRQTDDPTRPSFVNLVLGIVNQSFPRTGAYEFHIILNGEHKKTVPLYVAARETAPGVQALDRPT